MRSLFHIRIKGHIRKREEAEGHILSDLVLFLSRSSAQGQDELFSCKESGGARLILRGHAVREAINITCALNDLPRDISSSHSLRKGAILNMRMLGSTEADRGDRGGYSFKSTVMNNTHDYSTGLVGPLSCQGL